MRPVGTEISFWKRNVGFLDFKMCIIIDACVRDVTFGTNPSEAGSYVVKAIESARTRMVCGGKLLEELSGSQGANRRIREWIRSGKAIIVTKADLVQRAKNIDPSKMVSNDVHIIALAQSSGARTLFSSDTDLHADFKNRNLLDPPGAVFQHPDHGHLLGHTSTCGRG
jgi:predicted nucleic acid-binding protein